jgi:hypothetical protein
MAVAMPEGLGAGARISVKIFFTPSGKQEIARNHKRCSLKNRVLRVFYILKNVIVARLDRFRELSWLSGSAEALPI